MAQLTTRPMTAEEFAVLRARMIRSYAADKVRAGTWTADESLARSEADTDGLLPDGVATEGHVLLTALDGDAVVGSVWIGLQAPNDLGAWIYDIEILAPFRGRGYGRALLAAAERATAEHGVDTLGLNVFGPNTIARNLYESAGYEVTAINMSKRVAP